MILPVGDKSSSDTVVGDTVSSDTASNDMPVVILSVGDTASSDTANRGHIQ